MSIKVGFCGGVSAHLELTVGGQVLLDESHSIAIGTSVEFLDLLDESKVVHHSII